MAVLSRRPPLLSIVGACVLALASACVFTESLGLLEAEAPRGFNHRIHTRVGMDCEVCHAPDRWDEPDWPAAPLCLECHDGDAGAWLAAEQVEALLHAGPLAGVEPAGFSSEIIFSHRRHAEAGVACESCHVGVGDSEAIDGSLRLDMADCTACHDDIEGHRDRCDVCHGRLDIDVAPDSHHAQWMRLHGQVVRSEPTATVDDCTLCHSHDGCVTCHLDVPPENHTNIFRLRTHGAMAAMDRDNCSVCHRSDSCNSCHADTRPLSHTGAFGSPRNTHCMGCHLPVQETSCAVCHRSTPSHGQATPMPADHSVALNCRQCHGVDVSLKHVDNGSECILCHR